jgi:hypothetical protein
MRIASGGAVTFTNSVTTTGNLFWNSGAGVNWYIQGQANGPIIRMKYHGGTTDRSGALGWIDNSGNRYDALTWVDQSVTFGGSVTINSTLDVNQSSNTPVIRTSGNGNNQGNAFNYRIVRHYPVVSSGNKLIIPFVSQENLNSNTIVKIFGHSARFNARNPLAFSAYFAVGHLSVLSDLTAWGVNGNIASIGYGGGMNVEINFSSAYTSGEANGVYVTIEYMTNVPSYSINVAGITMN